jgi:predicted  nucleic acid-binding Zn-ribbon protein
MNNTQMTLTERNERLYELRQKLNKARAEVAWIEQEIWTVRDQYDRQDLDLFKEMFGDSIKVPSIYTDTPMAEEIYGG